MIVIEWLEFEIAYFEATVQYFCHNIMKWEKKYGKD